MLCWCGSSDGRSGETYCSVERSAQNDRQVYGVWFGNWRGRRRGRRCVGRRRGGCRRGRGCIRWNARTLAQGHIVEVEIDSLT